MESGNESTGRFGSATVRSGHDAIPARGRMQYRYGNHPRARGRAQYYHVILIRQLQPSTRAGDDRRVDTINSTPSQYGGTSADYLTARIARDRPDILERMKAGEYPSVRLWTPALSSRRYKEARMDASSMEQHACWCPARMPRDRHSAIVRASASFSLKFTGG